MKTGAGMVQDKRVDMGSMGDYNGIVGKNPGSRHQSHKESAMDRSPYYDKVYRNDMSALILWMGICHDNTSWIIAANIHSLRWMSNYKNLLQICLRYSDQSHFVGNRFSCLVCL